MKKHLKNNTLGFTIIEVLIVLAIVGVILAAIFLALPEVERNARDHERQAIATNIMHTLDAYAVHNDGYYPWGDEPCKPNADNTGEFCDFLARYIDGKVDVTDPSTGQSVFAWDTAKFGGPDADPCANPGEKLKAGDPCDFNYGEFVDGSGNYLRNPGDVQILFDAKCEGGKPVSTGLSAPIIGGDRTAVHYVITIGLDRPDTYFCIGN